MLADALNTQTYYKITDRGDRGLLFRAATTNRLETQGIRYMLCPATYAAGEDDYENDWIGVWNAVKGATATTGQLTIWNGLVWVAGATLSGDSPDTEASGWTVIPKASFANHEYIEMEFGVQYDFVDDWILKQWDMHGNVFGMSRDRFEDYYDPDEGYDNLVDWCDWNFSSSGNLFENNKCYFIYNNSNNSGIRDNSNTGDIHNNSNTGSIYVNKNTDEIKNNSNTGSIFNNTNDGGIFNNTNTANIGNNSNSGDISNNSNNGEVTKNSNNGHISENNSLPATTCDITMNQNNGSISGVWDDDVSDVVVDKVGSAE